MEESTVNFETIVQALHIIIGFLLMYVGYVELNQRGISQILSIVLILSGFVAISYGGYLMYFSNL